MGSTYQEISKKSICYIFCSVPISALIGVFFLGLETSGAASQAAAELFLGGEFTATFWSLVVVAGLSMPFAIEMIETRRALRPTAWAPILLLFGGLALRVILVSAGQV